MTLRYEPSQSGTLPKEPVPPSVEYITKWGGGVDVKRAARDLPDGAGRRPRERERRALRLRTSARVAFRMLRLLCYCCCCCCCIIHVAPLFLFTDVTAVGASLRARAVKRLGGVVDADSSIMGREVVRQSVTSSFLDEAVSVRQVWSNLFSCAQQCREKIVTAFSFATFSTFLVLQLHVFETK